jgi:hypothetical protein
MRYIRKFSGHATYLCALEDSVVRTHGFVFLVRNGRHFLEFMNDVIVCVVEIGIFTHTETVFR